MDSTIINRDILGLKYDLGLMAGTYGIQNCYLNGYKSLHIFHNQGVACVLAIPLVKFIHNG